MIGILREKLKDMVNLGFESIALEIFRYQFLQNPIYQQYCQLLGRSDQNVNSLESIPFLPIEFFKTHQVKSGQWKTEAIFKSSGTGSMQRSRHEVDSLHFYHHTAKSIFEYTYGPIDQYMFAALLPSYQQQGDSSLISMVDYFIRLTAHHGSAYFLHDDENLTKTITKNLREGKKVILIGVTYALLDLAERNAIDLRGCIVMETGGMKGRREEIIRQELHERLSKAFNVNVIHSEYGMTELLSQAYALSGGRFSPPATMRVIVRDMNDPFFYIGAGKTGGLNVIDLANIHSVSFIETKDIGSMHGDGTFSVLGRFDNSDIRGCNLLL